MAGPGFVFRPSHTSLCAWIVPEDVASGDLSDSVESRISNLRVFNMWVRFAPLPAPSANIFQINQLAHIEILCGQNVPGLCQVSRADALSAS